MINFRFHIVSLTAVLLAFGIGLLLGTAFFDDATVNFLRDRLDGLEDDLNTAESNNRDLQGEIDSFNKEYLALDEHLGERALSDQLAGDPVLVVAPNGIQGDLVNRSFEALTEAGGDLVGAWRLTERLVLDDDGEVADLAAVLGVTDDDPEVLRDALTTQLADVLAGVQDHAEGSTQAGGIVGAAAQPTEPELLTSLVEQGFVEYELPDGADGDEVLLPQEDLRILVVTGPEAVVPDGRVLEPTLRKLAANGPVPVVAAAPTPAEGDEEEDAEGQSTLLPTIVDDGSLADRISTVDDLERVAGRIGVVLALQDAVPGNPIVGHYGLQDSAGSLLPPVTEG